MLNIVQFRNVIIKPAMVDLMMYSHDAEELLVFTCATESDGGTFIHQINGPALGIYQMEPVTHNDIWHNYIKHNPKLMMLLSTNFNIADIPSEERLVYDLRYATAMARIFYARIHETLPDKNNVMAIWAYYKKYYNTAKGAAKENEAYKKYGSFIQNM